MTSVPTEVRDPSWIRARLHTLVPLLTLKEPEKDRTNTQGRLALPISAEEQALCAQVHALQERCQLSQVESDLLLLCSALAWVPPLDGLLPILTAPTRATLISALAVTLGSSLRLVRGALATEGALYHLADLSIEGEHPVNLRLDPETSSVRELGTPELSLDDMLRWLLPACPSAALPLSAHAHMADAVEVARRLLVGALATGARGVNVLIWGRPGVGKSELARGLAACGRAFEVGNTWNDGSAKTSGCRLNAWSTMQRLLAGQPDAIVVFDEAEDAIQSLCAPRGRWRDTTSKGSFTRQLEECATPTLWLANDISDLDPAALRRMTLVVEARQPPPQARLALAAQLLAPAGVSEHTRGVIASHPEVTPALLCQVARALHLARPDEALGADRAAITLLTGHVDEPLHLPRRVARFDPSLVEVEGGYDLADLARRLGDSGEGRVLLHGPPGTGKSAFARHVAERSGRPLHMHTAARLLSKWVGESEKQLEQAFKEASNAGAVLLLDEADAVLFTRSAASASWEGSQVAQALVEVERFTGVLVATSNLLPRIDPAFHRRFDLVLELAEPRPERRQRLVALLAEELGLPAPMIGAALPGLVPGHLEQLRRRWRLVGAPASTAALTAELRSVTGTRKAVGFAA